MVSVTDGVDTHADSHVVAAIDRNGGVLWVEAFPADPAGFEGLSGWLAGFGAIDKVGVEGTGSWGVGFVLVPHRYRYLDHRGASRG